MTLPEDTLKRLPLDRLHRDAGARMGGFAGYDMPLSYPPGTLKEHAACRSAAALFDVSHMGQIEIRGEAPLAALETVAPGALAGLQLRKTRYTVLLNERGGVVDDLMVTHWPDPDGTDFAGLVVNASRIAEDLALLRAKLPKDVEIRHRDDLALLALQGPKAAAIMARLDPGAEALPFMQAHLGEIHGVPVAMTRSGYTGEDGFEISLPAGKAEAIASLLLDAGAVWAGLAARDTLRLEAGLCLYGQELNEEISPVEADIVFAIGKKRRTQGDFPGHTRIMEELTDGPTRRRVGLRLEGRAPARAGTEIVNADGAVIGTVTSGTIGPTVGAPIAMAMLPPAYARPGTAVKAQIRGRTVPAEIVELPFVPHRYYRP